MVSCLTLLTHTHVLAPGGDGMRSRTLCGLGLSDADMAPGLMSTEPAAATCARCLQRLRIAAPVAGPSAPDARTLVRRLVDRLNANDPQGVVQTLGGDLTNTLPAGRVERLHELFPAWHATVVELIVDGNTAVLRYAVTCNDAFGMLGTAGPLERPGQAVVLRMEGAAIAAACAIVDDFAFWSALGRSTTACADCAPRTTQTGRTAYVQHHT